MSKALLKPGAIKRKADPSFFAPKAQRPSRGPVRNYAAMNEGRASFDIVSPSTIVDSMSNSHEASNTDEDTIIVEAPPGADDYDSGDGGDFEDILEPEFPGLTLEQRKSAVQAWFAGRKTHEAKRRSKGSYVSKFSLLSVSLKSNKFTIGVLVYGPNS